MFRITPNFVCIFHKILNSIFVFCVPGVKDSFISRVLGTETNLNQTIFINVFVSYMRCNASTAIS